MPDTLPPVDLDALRRETLGSSFVFRTPFGERLMVYADYTASGRNLLFVERYMLLLTESYANTHTEDDITGRSTTWMLHQAEGSLKRAVNGNRDTCIIAVGTGCTGALQKLQEILGVYVPPVARELIEAHAARWAEGAGGRPAESLLASLRREGPVVFVGPFEHHSNEISWRESLAEVVPVGLDKDGGVDLADLEAKLADPRYASRRRIGSFSAASNVTGMRAPVHEIARRLHRHGAIACFDYAAAAPYVAIDMNPAGDPEAALDAIAFSPHKYLGGPGSPGILLFNRRIYRGDLPPTFAAGGTVDYVGPTGQDYTADIETREKAGTPGTLQILRAALALELARAVGVERIEERERRYIRTALARLEAHPAIEILGNPDPDRRLAIVSFNIRHRDRYLHPKLVTRLLCDLFGIQSRAGCSCAGPYGHHLLGIQDELAQRYRTQIQRGFLGIKPGWVRVGFHYTMDEIDLEYVLRAIELLADRGGSFLNLYRLDLKTGSWSHPDEPPDGLSAFGLAQALALEERPRREIGARERQAAFDRYLEEARAVAGRLAEAGEPGHRSLTPELEPLAFFHAARHG